MAAFYNGLAFDTSLLAQWAAFFDLAGWEWSSNIAPIGDWKPDYRVTFKCGHSECGDSHTILVSVLSINEISSIIGHPALKHFYGVVGSSGKNIADAGAVFGINPSVTHWQMSHGAGGGVDMVHNWVDDADDIWRKAGILVQASGAET